MPVCISRCSEQSRIYKPRGCKHHCHRALLHHTFCSSAGRNEQNFIVSGWSSDRPHRRLFEKLCCWIGEIPISQVVGYPCHNCIYQQCNLLGICSLTWALSQQHCRCHSNNGVVIATTVWQKWQRDSPVSVPVDEFTTERLRQHTVNVESLLLNTAGKNAWWRPLEDILVLIQL